MLHVAQVRRELSAKQKARERKVEVPRLVQATLLYKTEKKRKD